MRNGVITLRVNESLPLDVRKKYAFWRNMNFVSLFVIHLVFFIVKCAFKKTYGSGNIVTTTEYATMAMLFNVFYGLSKFAGSQIGNRANAKWLLCSGLFLSSIFNLVSGAYSSVVYITTMLCISAWFQGFCWPPASKIFVKWYAKPERGIRLGIWTTSRNIGGAIAPFLVIPMAFIPLEGVGEMVVPSALGIATSILMLFTIKDSPKLMNLPTVEEYLNVPEEVIDIKDKNEKDTWWNNIKTVFKNKWLWLFFTAYCAAMIFRLAPGDFMFKYISEYHELGSKKSSGTVGNIAFMLFELIGIPASIFAGWLTDHMVRKGKGRFGIMTISFIAAIGGFIILWVAPKGNIPTIIIGVILTAWPLWMIISSGGPVMMDICPKRILVTSIGFKGIMGYVVASLLGNLVAGALIHNVGWNAFFGFILGAGIFGTLCFALLFKFKKPVNVIKQTPIKK